jgi:isopentenyl diphosphate isomerase/L-lactate dehydrogenase-like FMN-dependent dehydrogenase
MRVSRISNYEAARLGARRAIPRALFDFIDGGADDEVTLRQNHDAFQRLTFRPRQAISIPDPDLRVTVLGSELSMPVALAPCGGSRLVWPDGERTLARAAGAERTGAAMSTASGTPLEEVAEVAAGPIWYQLYYPGARETAEALVRRAAAARFSALFITIDLPVRGNQERVRSAERIVPPRPTVANAIRYAPQLLSRPGWTYRYLRDGRTDGVRPKSSGSTDSIPQLPRGNRPNVTWSDIEWLRSIWEGPLVLKGILTAADARRAVSVGADALVVSNHGGRQLDGTPATIRALPEIREEVGRSVEVLLDGGVQRATDVVKAVAAGADAVLIGRFYLYGMAVGGEAGVRRVLQLFREELIRTLKLLGRASMKEIDATCIGQLEQDRRTWLGSLPERP